MENLGVEMVDNYSKYLPWVEADIAVVGDDNENNDLVNYLIVTNYNEGDRTIPDHELYEFAENDKNLIIVGTFIMII